MRRPTTQAPARRTFLRMMGAAAVGVAAGAAFGPAFGPAIRRAAARAAVSDRPPQPRRLPRWIGHF